MTSFSSTSTSTQPDPDFHAGYGDNSALELADLRAAQRVSQTGSWAIDVRTGQRYRSQECLRLLAVSPEEAHDRHLPMQRIVDPDRWRLQRAVDLLLETGAELDEICSVQAPDGVRRVVHFHGHREPGADHAAGRVVGTIQDITEKYQVREELQQVSAALNAVLRNSPTAIYVKAPNGRFILANDETARIFGAKPADLLGATLFDLLPEDIATELTAHDLDVIAQNRTLTIEETAPHAEDGMRIHTWLSSKFPVMDQDGQLLGIGGVSLDVTQRMAVDRERRAADARFRALVDAAPDGLVIGDAQGTIILVNQRIEEMFGFDPASLIGRKVATLLPESDRSDHRARLAGFVSDPDLLSVEQTLELAAQRADGTTFPVEVSLSRVPTAEGVLIAAAIRDATSRITAEAEIARLATIVSSSHDAILSKTLDGTIVSWNPSAEEMYGYTAAEAVGRPVAMLLPEHADPNEITDVLARVGQGEVIRLETERQTRSGDVIDVELVVSPIRDGSGTIVGASTIAREVTERKRFEHQLQFLASHDPLTGLFNRRRFELELSRVLEESAGGDGLQGALLIVDLDNFKEINDHYGHAAGDLLVKAVSDRMSDTLRQSDVIARIGGDEFAILIEGANPEGAMKTARTVLDAIVRHPVLIDADHRASVTASVGVRTFDGGTSTTPTELSVEADAAMYEAKAAGKNRCVMYDADADRSPEASRLPWLDRLRNALAEDRVELHAQPIIGLSGDQLPHYELLLRLRGDDGTLLNPGRFLHHAERADLMGEIDRWVLHSAARLLNEHAAAGHDLALTVNLSGKTMNDVTLPHDLAEILETYPVPAGRLVVEVTETAAIVNMERARDLARDLRALGCQFALDDFGAGFASFYYLKHLDFDYLKIDGEFIKSLTSTPTDQLVVKAVVDIARGLATETIAECVSDTATVSLLQRLGVDYGQGYHLGKPLPLDQALPALEQL